MILLLRHGDAEPDQGDGDAARRLTAKGEAQAVAAGRAIARIGLEVEICLTSPRVRALATARLACESLDLDPEISEPIGTGDYDTLELVAGRENVLLVGHEPALSTEVARLTGAPAFKVRSLRRLQVTWEPGALADAVVALAALDAQVKGGLGGTAGLEPAQKAHALESYVIATTGLRQRRADPGAGRPSGPR